MRHLRFVPGTKRVSKTSTVKTRENHPQSYSPQMAFHEKVKLFVDNELVKVADKKFLATYYTKVLGFSLATSEELLMLSVAKIYSDDIYMNYQNASYYIDVKLFNEILVSIMGPMDVIGWKQMGWGWTGWRFSTHHDRLTKKRKEVGGWTIKLSRIDCQDSEKEELDLHDSILFQEYPENINNPFSWMADLAKKHLRGLGIKGRYVCKFLETSSRESKADIVLNCDNDREPTSEAKLWQ